MKQTRRQFVRTLFIATQAAAFGPGLAKHMYAADAKAGALNFLLLGDWGRKGEPDQAAVAKQMGICGAKMEPKFVVAVGDNFYEDGVASVTDPHWQNSFEKVYTAPSLQVPWWAALGNHDYHGNCDAQIEYSHSPKARNSSKRWNMPARYYPRTEKIDAKNSVDFFYLDTTPMAGLDAGEITHHGNVKSQDVPKQMAWFKAALAASTAPWKIVVGHHPIYTGGQHGDTPYLVKHVLPLLEKHGVQVYFNGHDHDLQHLQAGKVDLFCTGGGSTPRKAIKTTAHTKFGLGCSGFIAASLSADALAVRMIDDTGKLLYSTCVPRGA
jgi:tartrate-resistant acid phosphatase type 5